MLRVHMYWVNLLDSPMETMHHTNLDITTNLAISNWDLCKEVPIGILRRAKKLIEKQLNKGEIQQTTHSSTRWSVSTQKSAIWKQASNQYKMSNIPFSTKLFSLPLCYSPEAWFAKLCVTLSWKPAVALAEELRILAEVESLTAGGVASEGHSKIQKPLAFSNPTTFVARMPLSSAVFRCQELPKLYKLSHSSADEATQKQMSGNKRVGECCVVNLLLLVACCGGFRHGFWEGASAWLISLLIPFRWCVGEGCWEQFQEDQQGPETGRGKHVLRLVKK